MSEKTVPNELISLKSNQLAHFFPIYMKNGVFLLQSETKNNSRSLLIQNMVFQLIIEL